MVFTVSISNLDSKSFTQFDVFLAFIINRHINPNYCPNIKFKYDIYPLKSSDLNLSVFKQKPFNTKTNTSIKSIFTCDKDNYVEFVYNKCEIKINFKYNKEIPKLFEGKFTEKYCEMKIIFNSKEDYTKVWNDLSSTVYNLYKKLVEDKDNKKLNIYINEQDYWEKSNVKSKRKLSTIYLPKQDKQYILNDMTWFLDSKTKLKYEKIGRNYKRVYLFEGIPGSGKTSFISAIASEYNYNLAVMQFTDNVNDAKLISLLSELPENTILLLEDIDSLFEERKKHDEYKNRITFSGLLNVLDGVSTPEGLICFITTNYKDVLDSALIRPGRVDKILKFDYATKEQIKDVFTNFMEDEYTDEIFKTFYGKFKDLRIKCNVATIQEYLFKYLEQPLEAIEHIDELKNIYESSKEKETEANMYN